MLSHSARLAVIAFALAMATCRPPPEQTVQRAEERLANIESKSTVKVARLRADEAERISAVQGDARKAAAALEAKGKPDVTAAELDKLHTREAERIAKIQARFTAWVDAERKRVEEARQSLVAARLHEKAEPMKGSNGGELLVGALVSSSADLLGVRSVDGERIDLIMSSASRAMSRGHSVVLKLCQQGTPIRVETVQSPHGLEARVIDVLSLDTCEATALAD